MSAHVEWLGASCVVEVVTPEEGWTDPYGTGIDDDKIGLALSGDDVVMIEGDLPGLRNLVERITDALDAYERTTDVDAD